MNKKIITAVAVASMLATSLPAFAEVSATVNATGGGLKVEARKTDMQANKDSKVEVRMNINKEKGTAAIDARVTRLNELLTRVKAMKRVTDAGKTSISTTVQALITNLTALKAQIIADSSTTTVKADVASITKSYRVYALVMPQIQLIATVDRILTLADQLTTIRAKLAVRVSAATSLSNIADLQALLLEMDTKIADAKVKAGEAMNAISPLVPDEGDKAKMAANTTALKTAHEKVKLAEASLRTARQDAEKISKSLRKGMNKATTTGATN